MKYRSNYQLGMYVTFIIIIFERYVRDLLIFFFMLVWQQRVAAKNMRYGHQ